MHPTADTPLLILRQRCGARVWATDKRKNRVVDFPYDKKAKYQMFRYVGPGFAATLLPNSGPDGRDPEMFKRPNPPDNDRIDDFSEFKGRRVAVYYTVREREVNGKKLKYNDVWRILVLPAGKK